MDMEGVNFVTCPRCAMHVLFGQGEGRPPGACPHCGMKMEGFRQAECAGCGGGFETAAPAGSGVACPRCGTRGVAPAGAGETATVRKNVPARLRGGATVAADETPGRDPGQVRWRRLAALVWAGGMPTAALAAAAVVLVAHRAAFPSADRFASSALPAAGVAAAVGAIAWAVAAWRAGR